MKMEQTECSEMSAYKIQTPGNYPKESIQQLLKLCRLWYVELSYVQRCVNYG